MQKELLNIEIRLLVHRYGHRAVVRSLAEIKDISLAEIAASMAAVDKKKKKTVTKKKKVATKKKKKKVVTKKKKKKTVTKKKKIITASEKAQRDINSILERVTGHDNAELLTKLVNLFQNKMFLPALKDVRQFLERRGVDTRTLRSRANSAKKLFDELEKLPKKELESTLEELPGEGESGFSVLANAIIGERRGPR